MLDRRVQIIRLLETRDDHLPAVRPPKAFPPRGFVSGLDEAGKPLRWLTCEDCLANDRRMFGCETCGGTGRVPDPGSDPYQQNDVQPYGFDRSYQDRQLALDAAISTARNELSRLPGFRPQSTAEELEDANAHPEAWERERRLMYQAFDYHALDQALEQLRERDEGAYRMLHSVYVYRWQQFPSASMEAACDRGLSFLDDLLPHPLRAPGEQPAAGIIAKLERGAGNVARGRRDAQIRELAAQGAKPAEIAAACHVSIRTVYLVVNAA